jgi:hypothetical protein
MKQTFAAIAAIRIGIIDVWTKVARVRTAARKPTASATDTMGMKHLPPHEQAPLGSSEKVPRLTR